MTTFSFAKQSGAAMALMAAALFGASAPLAKLLLGDGVDPWLLAGLLYAGSGGGLTIAYALEHRGAAEAQLSRTDLPWLALVVLAGGVVAPVLMMFGLASTPASTVSLLLNLETLATMAIAWIAFKEFVDVRLLLGALAILGGALVLSYHGGIAVVGMGTLAIAGACLAWGTDNNLTRKISAKNPVQIAAIKGVAAGAINLILAWIRHAQVPSLLHVSAALLLGLISYGVSVVLFVFALRKLGAARTSAYFSTAPFVGAVLAIALLGEPVSVRLSIAGVLMAIGVYIHLSEQHDHTHTHERGAHEHLHEHDQHHQHEHAPNDPSGEPHSHWHEHEPMTHSHPHYPDIHHRHGH